MNKKMLISVIATGAISLAVVGTIAAINDFNKNNVKAENEMSLTITKADITYSGNNATCYTDNRNEVTFNISNANKDAGDAICSINGNGGGIYFLTKFQHIVSVQVVATSEVTIERRSMSFSVNSGFDNTHSCALNCDGSETIMPEEDSIDNCTPCFFFGASGSHPADQIYVSSITINYTCA